MRIFIFIQSQQWTANLVIHVYSTPNSFLITFRVILSACSPYFRAMFTGELAESRQTEVTIRDIDEHAMELLIDFCYTSYILVEVRLKFIQILQAVL